MKSKQKIQTPMRELDSKKRITHFEEVALGYSQDEAFQEANRCLQCKDAPCIGGCPVGIDIPGFIKALRENRMEEASLILKFSNSLPAICGRVCPQETQCEKACLLSKVRETESVAIGRLERFVSDWEALNPVTLPQIPLIGTGRVAVVGSGPAGLTCSSELSRMGYAVTILEALHTPGGVLVYGIPEFRLPKKIVEREVNTILELGVQLETNVIVGKTVLLEELIDQYDAVFLGIGTGTPKFMGIPGTNLNGVMSSSEFLTRINLMKAYRFPEYDTPISVHGHVIVVGGGNVALDCARSAIRSEADSVTIVYRRTRSELPARMEEIHHSMEEGVQFKWLSAPVAYLGEEGWVHRVQVQKMELGQKDESGRRRPIPIPGAIEELPIDLVIEAIGQSANRVLFDSGRELSVNQWGNIQTFGDDGITSLPGVYAGGDIVTGSATVIEAMGAGKAAARGIHEFISSRNRSIHK